MRTILFDLSPAWNGVIEFFNDFLEEDINEEDSYSYLSDVNSVSLYWLSQRLYQKLNLICVNVLETRVSFEVELAITHDADTLINMDKRLWMFDNYLNFANIGYYNLSKNVDIKVLNRIMIISER